ncbi:replication restart helicase PriA [Gaopeijia maritima]|uniref:Replication restart protein PriA n=1 Tax=Gaopeijia maritima TaxID=3119007 RepID=A0ABU9EA02_9BACT
MTPTSSRAGRRLVAVALPVPIHGTFTYSVAGDPPAPGTRVRVPFGRQERIGWVVGEGSAEGVSKVRPVLDVLDERPSIAPELLDVCRWMAQYYAAPPGLAIAATQPAVLSDVSRDYIGLDGEPPAEAGSRVVRLVDALREGEAGSLHRVATLRKRLGMGSIWPEIRALKAAGVLRHEVVPPQEPSVKTHRVVRTLRDLPDLAERDEIFGRAHRQREAWAALEDASGRLELSHMLDVGGFSRSVVSGLEAKGLVEVVDEEVVRDPFADRDPPAPIDHPLTDDQRRALEAIRAEIGADAPRPVLLHGITGSGKTRVYIEVLKAVIARGRGAIVLVPEISLTPQTVTRFRGWFGDRVAVLHSALSDGERYDAWRQLHRGEKTVAVGARSALFAPVANLGAIIVDEEHDGSYKQSDAPRYQARDLAVVRAGLNRAVCVLGSATPSLESWANAEKGKYQRVSLPVRVAGRPLPPVHLLDLRKERSKPKTAGGAASEAGLVLTDRLVQAVLARLERNEQSILLLNRRGYASFVQCRECGEVGQCPNCSISLTYHRRTGRVVCHHCRYEEPAPSRCSRCGSTDLSFRGLGTEQVERVVVESFPGARVARMDVDTTSGKWAHHEILGRVERGEVDILLGTQMIAKGLDFPRVTLVGVVNADVGIHLPDFRASERTFQLLSQVAGRAGRGELGGEVLIQTSLPEHYALQSALDHDYPGFARRELEERLNPPYPPHVRLANVVISSPDDNVAADQAEAAVAWLRHGLRNGPAVTIVGPAPAPIERLHGRWRWHFLLRAARASDLGRVCRGFVRGFQPRGHDVRVALDRDPVALL